MCCIKCVYYRQQWICCYLATMMTYQYLSWVFRDFYLHSNVFANLEDIATVISRGLRMTCRYVKIEHIA